MSWMMREAGVLVSSIDLDLVWRPTRANRAPSLGLAAVATSIAMRHQ
jgi:hypothetical protein